MSQNSSPNQLRPQEPSNAKSKRAFYIVVGVLTLLLIVTVLGISSTGNKKNSANQKEVYIDDEQKGVLPFESDGRGLALPPKLDEKRIDSFSNLPTSPVKNTDIKENDGKPLYKVIGKEEKDPEAEALRLAKEEVRRQKQEFYYSAITAPVLVKRLNSTDTALANAQVVQSQAGTQTSLDSLSSTKSNYDPSADKDKEEFFQRADEKEWIFPYTREAGRPFELKTGAVIQGTMVTGINSDLPGNLIAQVSQNIYDSSTGNHLLIPQGSKLYGVYDSRVVFGQSRVLIAWNRVIFPDGSSVTLGAMPGTDMAGYSGFNDKVDNHYLRIFGSAILMSLITGGTSYAVDKVSNNNGDNNNNITSLQDSMASALAVQLGQATASLLEKNLNIKPTLEIRPGYRFNIVITKDIIFKGAYNG